MARRDELKPMLPLEMPPGHIQCADDPNCRKPGRLRFEGMAPNELVCIFHAYQRYARGERDTSAT